MYKHSHQVNDLLQLIGTVYDAAFDETHWRNLPSAISRTFRSMSTTLQMQCASAQSDILSMTDNVSARIGDNRQHDWQHDIWVEGSVENIGLSRVGMMSAIVTDTKFKNMVFYREWCRYLNLFNIVGAVFPSGPGSLAVLGIHRSRSAGTYQEQDRYAVSQFLPHLQRALRIRQQLVQAAVERRISFETLERSENSIVLVTPNASIVFANSQAEAMISSGREICSRNGRLLAEREGENSRLAALILAASGLPGDSRTFDGIMTIRRPNRQPLNILVAPFRLALPGLPASGAIVFVRDPDRQISAIATLRVLFNFTPTEARIAQALANGKTIAEIAAINRAKLQTVQKQIKDIFVKTETRRQSECVAAILRSVAMIARG